VLTELFWTHQSAYPVLAALQLLPLLAAGLMVLLRRLPASRVLMLALALALAELLLVVQVFFLYLPGEAALQFAERLELPGPLDYHVAIDGVSIVFLVLAVLLTLLVLLYGPTRELHPTWLLNALIFGVQGAFMVQICTLNLLWLLPASALEFGLVGYLLWRWGGTPDKDLALSRFYQFMGTSLLLLLVGALLLAWDHGERFQGRWSFDLLELVQVPRQMELQTLVFYLLFYGFAIRTPLFPLHGWLPLVAEHGNIAIAPALLLGLKLGLYGMLRFVFPLVPDAVLRWQGYVVAFAVVGIFYAALLAMWQTNLRRLLAFAVVSHTGLLVVGMFSLELAALQGSVILTVTFGLAIATLVFMMGLVYQRTHSISLDRLGALMDQIPAIGIAFLVAGVSIFSMPGTPGFGAVHLVLESSMHRFGGLVTIAAALGNLLSAGFLLWAFQRTFLAPRKAGLPPWRVERVAPLEYLVAGISILVLLVTGFHLDPWLHLVEGPLRLLAERIG